MTATVSRLLALLILLGLAACADALPKGVREKAADQAPDQTRGLVLVEHLDEALPLELKFQDQNERSRKLGDWFGKGMPVLLSFNYADCPMLCGQQLNGLTDCLSEMDLVPGQDFKILTVSLDPHQGLVRGRKQQRTYWERMMRPEVPLDGWEFLQAPKATVKQLTDAVGYPYRYDPDQQQYIHRPIYAVCTPDGRISRYLETVAPDPQVLRRSLVEASEGKIGTVLDQVFLWCFHYDPEAGGYIASAVKLMSAGGVVILVVLGLFLWRLWGIDLRRQRKAADSQA